MPRPCCQFPRNIFLEGVDGKKIEKIVTAEMVVPRGPDAVSQMDCASSFIHIIHNTRKKSLVL